MRDLGGMLTSVSTRQQPVWPPPGGLPWPAHVLVADTNFLARSAWFLARHPDQPSVLEEALRSGRSSARIAAHVPGEMPRAIRRIARGADPTAALAVWESQLAPLVRVVEIPVALHLNPAIWHVLREDPDDLPTAALALFLAPAVVLTTDGVFANAGLPVPDSPMAAVKALKIAGGHETTAYVGSLAAWGGARGTWSLMGRLVAAARQNPLVALAVLAAGASALLLVEDSSPGAAKMATTRIRSVLQTTGTMTGRIAMHVLDEHAVALVDVPEVLRSGPQTLEEASAAILARCGRPMSVIDLKYELTQCLPGFARPTRHTVSAAGLTEALRAHPAFTHKHSGWLLGRPVTTRPPHAPE